MTVTGTVLTGATAVTFGSTAATHMTFVNATTITATTPAHAAGTVDVTITTPAGHPRSYQPTNTPMWHPAVTAVAPGATPWYRNANGPVPSHRHEFRARPYNRDIQLPVKWNSAEPGRVHGEYRHATN